MAYRFNESDLSSALGVLAERRRYSQGPGSAPRRGLFGLLVSRNRAESVRDADALISAVLEDGFGLGGNFPSRNEVNGYSARSSITLDEMGSPVLEVRVRNNARPNEVAAERFAYEKGFGFIRRDRLSQPRLNTSDSPGLEKFYKDVDSFRTLYSKQYCESFRPVSASEARRVSGTMDKRASASAKEFEKARLAASKIPPVRGFDDYTARVQRHDEALASLHAGKMSNSLSSMLALRAEEAQLRAYERHTLPDELAKRLQVARRKSGSLAGFDDLQQLASRSANPKTEFAVLAVKQGYGADDIKDQIRKRYPDPKDNLGWVDNAKSIFSAQMADRYRSFVEEHPVKVFSDGSVQERVERFASSEDRLFENHAELLRTPKLSESFDKKYIVNGQSVRTESVTTDSVQFLHVTAENREAFAKDLRAAGVSFGKTGNGLDTMSIAGTTKADMGDGLFVRLERDAEGRATAHHTTKESFQEALGIKGSLDGDLSREQLVALGEKQGVTIRKKEYNAKKKERAMGFGADFRKLPAKRMTPGRSAANDTGKLHRTGIKPA